MRGLITLIPKRGRDSRVLKHNRPITLLNSDYKYLEKCIANRIKPLLNDIIHRDQKGFLQNRRVSANIRCILDILDYVNNDCPEEDAVIMQLDYEKCFDRVEIPSLLGALDYFNFGSTIQHWTKTLYKGAQSCISNNGYTSNWFPVTRSVKQGGPCSSYFFLIIAEILAILLRSNDKIEGIHIGDFSKLFGQYADDMDIYCKNTRQNVTEIDETISHYCGNTGFKINYDKTTIYRVGQKNNAIAGVYTVKDMTVVQDKINVLGVWVSNSAEETLNLNYSETLKKVKTVLLSWENRGLSLLGKVLVLNSLIASLFVYKMYVLPRMPKNITNTGKQAF